MAVGALVLGQRGTTTIEQTQRKVDMAEKILLLEPESNPLTVLTKKIDKKKAVNPKFQWLEKELDPRFDTINNVGGYAAGATSLVVNNGGYYEPQQIVFIPRTGESIRVTAVASNTLTVVRGVGSTAQAINQGEELLLIGAAQPEGDVSRQSRSRNASPVLNYLQIFRLPWEATNTDLYSEFYADDDWDNQALVHGIEHAKNIEYGLLFGNPSEDTSTGQARRTTGGFQYFVKTNVTDAGGVMAEASFFSALRPMFRYGSKTAKVGMTAQLVVDVISNYPRGKIEVVQSEKTDPGNTYGLRLTQVVSPHGTLTLVTHYLLEGATLGGQLWLVDLSNVKYRYLEDKRGVRDTHIRTNIQPPDQDGRKDEYLTECGLQFGLEKTHGKIINITG